MISVLKNLLVGFENPSSHLPAVAWLCQVTTIIRPLAYKIYKGRRPYNNCHGSGHPVARRERLRGGAFHDFDNVFLGFTIVQPILLRDLCSVNKTKN